MAGSTFKSVAEPITDEGLTAVNSGYFISDSVAVPRPHSARCNEGMSARLTSSVRDLEGPSGWSTAVDLHAVWSSPTKLPYNLFNARDSARGETRKAFGRACAHLR